MNNPINIIEITYKDWYKKVTSSNNWKDKREDVYMMKAGKSLGMLNDTIEHIEVMHPGKPISRDEFDTLNKQAKQKKDKLHMMKPSLLDRILWPTMHERCRLICVELGESNYGDYTYEHGNLIISGISGFESIIIGIKDRLIYADGWIPGINKECKQKIKQAINKHFAMAMDVRKTRRQQQREQDRQNAEELNQICSGWEDGQI